MKKKNDIALLEEEARMNYYPNSWSEGLYLLPTVLDEMMRLDLEWIPCVMIIEAVSPKDPEFEAKNIRFALEILGFHGLVERKIPEYKKCSLVPPKPVYRLSSIFHKNFN